MFEKYYNGVIEQVYEKVGAEDGNIVMVCYNNSFSVQGLKALKRYSESMDKVFFTWKEYSATDIVGAYDPFLDIVCEIHREYIKGDFDEFLFWMERRGSRYPFSIFGCSTFQFMRIRDEARRRGFTFND